ncbi:uncharacterized protein LOC123261377 [Cotesia glomerata]|uniref:uncharacterized protein LOC123261377 n=1 Tax=Cotesia glomerata TaxID=32391 RepID=UPI001D00F731|nr:uncharacterized protein LOC123261377 [Cotesia glomerata]
MPKLKRKSATQRQEENTSYKRIKRDVSENNNVINNTNDNTGNVNKEKNHLLDRTRQQRYLLKDDNLTLHKERMQIYRSLPEYKEKNKTYQRERLTEVNNYENHLRSLRLSQQKRLQDPIHRKNHHEQLKVNQSKRLLDPINRKNHQEQLKVNQIKRLKDPINREKHQKQLKVNQSERLQDPINKIVHNEHNKKCQTKRLMDKDKKNQHNEKNQDCQSKRLRITSKREIHNKKLIINQKKRLQNEKLRKIHIQRVSRSRASKKAKVEDLKRNVLFNKFNLLKLEGPTYECSSCCRLCCERAIKNNKIPTLSLYYKELQFPKVPDEILNLTELEERFICPRIPFMMIRAIINDGQYFVKGRAVNVPTNVETSVSILPRVQSEAMIIPICFRRKKSFKSNVMFENVRPQVIKKAALVLQNSEVYKRCKIKLDFQRKKNSTDNNNDNKYPSENVNNVDEIDDNLSDENSEDEEPVNVEDESTLLLTQAIVFAPGEGQLPVSLFDEYAEALSFIKIYGGKLIKKPEHITYQNWIKSEIMRSDRRCATIIKLFFSALKLRTSKIASSINFCLRKNKIKSKLMKVVDMLDDNNIKYMELNDSGFKFLSHDRGSPSFWEEKKKNVFALFRQIGPPNLFFTLSAAETKWPELIVILKKVVDEEEITLEQAEKMDYKEKARLISGDPVTIARYFDYRIRELFKVMKENNSIFREHNIIDFYYRIEFQQRGSPHIHCLLWLENAPNYDDEDENNLGVIRFIDKFITCSNKLLSRELIKLQTHRHTFTCKKGLKKIKCRFDIPFFPMIKTCILKPFSTMEKERKNELRKVREDIQKFLEENFKKESIISIEQMLKKFRITYDSYIEIIRSGLYRPTVMLRRNPDECMINSYNQELLKLHSANMDIQFILDMYSCASYVLNYLNKPISGLSRLMYDVTNEVKRGNYTMKEQLRLIANAFLKASEFGSQEAVYYILALPLSKCSREVTFVNTNLPENRIQVVKSKEDLKKLPLNSTDIYIKDTLDHYIHRPHELEDTCLASFVSWYNYSTKEYHRKNKIYSDDESDDDHCIDNSISLKLIDNSGFVRKRRKSKVLRFINYDEQTDIENFTRENVMLFIPWRNENILITSTSSLFLKNQNLIKERRSEYVYNKNIENLLKEATQKMIEFDNEDKTDGNTPKNLEVFDDPTREGDISIDMNESGTENRNCDDKDIHYVSIPRLVTEEHFIDLVVLALENLD